jgi:beta-barrel assembly-enhancing protease
MKSTFIACAVACGLLIVPPQALIAQSLPSTLPTLGDDTGMSLGAERRLGDQIGREILSDPDYVADPVLDAYVQSLWQPLVAAAKLRGELPPEMDEAFAWQLFLVRDKSVNAFALPGGYFGVHLGLLALVDTPDELASVLAHELTHVTQRHIARGMSKQNAQSPWLLAGAILAMLVATRSTNANTDAVSQGALAASQAAGIQSRLNFSRDMEREADRIGHTLMAPAGYAPAGFVGMFNKLALAARLNDNGSFPYLRSHPLTTERIADMTARTNQDSNQSAKVTLTTASNNALALHRLMAVRARVLADLSVDALKNHVSKALNTQPLPNGVTDLYAGALAAWQLKDAALAGKLYKQLMAQAPLSDQSPAISQALRWLGADLQLAVGLDLASSNRAEMLYAAQAASRVGAAPESMDAAISRLKLWLATQPRDAAAWEVLSRLYAAHNQRIRAIMAQAQGASARLDDSAALAQYQAAQSLIRQSPKDQTDAMDAAIVDSKVRELQRRVRDLTDRPAK